MKIVKKIEMINLKGKRFSVCAIAYSKRETREYKDVKHELNQLFKKR